MTPACQQFEWTLAWHCAPALTGLKAADLVAWAPPRDEGKEILGRYAALLARRGIGLRVLGRRGERTLLLVFRRRRLDSWLREPQVAAMLRAAGYPVEGGTRAMLSHLRKKLEGPGFPHEIGLFLGYPPGDVAGFLRDGGRGCKLCGPWKVYGDVEQARRRFRAFRCCRMALTRRVEQGIPLARVFPAA